MNRPDGQLPISSKRSSDSRRRRDRRQPALDWACPPFPWEWWRLPLWVAACVAWEAYARYLLRRGRPAASHACEAILDVLVVTGPAAIGAVFVHPRMIQG